MYGDSIENQTFIAFDSNFIYNFIFEKYFENHLNLKLSRLYIDGRIHPRPIGHSFYTNLYISAITKFNLYPIVQSCSRYSVLVQFVLVEGRSSKV